jgi:hypothetical protein
MRKDWPYARQALPKVYKTNIACETRLGWTIVKFELNYCPNDDLEEIA